MKNPDKTIDELEKRAHLLEDEMKYELHKLKRTSKKAVTISIFAGAGALSAVALTKLLSAKKKPDQVVKEKKKETRQKLAKVKKKSAFSSRVQAAVFALLLELGRKKMMDFLNSKVNDNKPS